MEQQLQRQVTSLFGLFEIEFVAILTVGLYLHLKELSVIDLKYSKLPGIQPNPASILFVFSILCILCKSRPYWPSCLRHPPRIIRFLIELLLTLYLTDLILRQVWMPMLRFLDFGFDFLGEYMIVVNKTLLANQMTAISSWLKNRGFYYARFVLAFGMFYFMAEVTGFMDYCRCIKAKLVRSNSLINQSSVLSSAQSDITLYPRSSSTSPRKRRDIDTSFTLPQQRSSKRNNSIIPRKLRVR